MSSKPNFIMNKNGIMVKNFVGKYSDVVRKNFAKERLKKLK